MPPHTNTTASDDTNNNDENNAAYNRDDLDALDREARAVLLVAHRYHHDDDKDGPATTTDIRKATGITKGKINYRYDKLEAECDPALIETWNPDPDDVETGAGTPIPPKRVKPTRAGIEAARDIDVDDITATGGAPLWLSDDVGVERNVIEVASRVADLEDAVDSIDADTAAEQRVADLEAEVDALQADVEQLRRGVAAVEEALRDISGELDAVDTFAEYYDRVATGADAENGGDDG